MTIIEEFKQMCVQHDIPFRSRDRAEGIKWSDPPTRYYYTFIDMVMIVDTNIGGSKTLTGNGATYEEAMKDFIKKVNGQVLRVMHVDRDGETNREFTFPILDLSYL